MKKYFKLFQYALKDVAVVKGREFLTCRTFKRIGNEIMEAARSFDLEDVPRNPLKIRYVFCFQEAEN